MTFSHKKATQAINFFACRNGGAIEKLRLLKLIFFADRYHLRKFGRPITNDPYWAMQFGPVASSVKELAEMDTVSGAERHYAMTFIRVGSRHKAPPAGDTARGADFSANRRGQPPSPPPMADCRSMICRATSQR